MACAYDKGEIAEDAGRREEAGGAIAVRGIPNWPGFSSVVLSRSAAWRDGTWSTRSDNMSTTLSTNVSANLSIESWDCASAAQIDRMTLVTLCIIASNCWTHCRRWNAG